MLAVHTGKQLCARFYRRADGTIMMQDCPWSLRVMARKVSRLGAAILTAILSVSLASAKNKTRQPSCDCLQIQQKDSGVKLTVMDQQGAVIPGAGVLLENKSNQQKAGGLTGASGQWQQPKLAPGRYSIVIKSQGFRSFTGTVKVNDGMLLELKIKLPVADVNTTVVVEAEPLGVMGSMGTITAVPSPQMSGFGSAGRPAPMRR